jgi:CRP-like cAMP-binding protein
LRRTSLALEELALFELPERLARLLLKLAEDYGRPCPEGVRIELKLSQRDLANQVASSRETVNKQLRIWRDEGVVSIENGYIIIRRMDELKRIVG